MSRASWAGVFSVLLAASVIMGAYSTITLQPVQGFSPADLHTPGSFTAAPLPQAPDVAGDTTARPEMSIMIYIGQVFAEYGGAVRIEASNNGTRDLFILDAAFDWVGTGLVYEQTVNARIAPGEACTIPAMAIGAPQEAGMHDYQLRLRCLQLRGGEWYRVISGGDDWLSFSEHSVEVLGLPEPAGWDVDLNTRPYYSKLNGLVGNGSEAVTAAVLEATGAAESGIGGGTFDMGKACAIFDYLDRNINYTEDEGGDKWYSPDRTLETREGDCEDYAMLLASMVKTAGGTARVYLTVDHAFAAVYAGNASSDLSNATGAVRAYYGADLHVHALADESGFWVVADPLGSFYLGGPAVGQVPTGLAGGGWNMSFEGTDLLYSLDVTGDPETVPMWLDTMFWMGMMLLTGFCALGFTVAAMSERPETATQYCHICAGEIAGDLYVCPTCKTTYHGSCAYSKAYCMTCTAIINANKPPIAEPPSPWEKKR